MVVTTMVVKVGPAPADGSVGRVDAATVCVYATPERGLGSAEVVVQYSAVVLLAERVLVAVVTVVLELVAVQRRHVGSGRYEALADQAVEDGLQLRGCPHHDAAEIAAGVGCVVGHHGGHHHGVRAGPLPDAVQHRDRGRIQLLKGDAGQVVVVAANCHHTWEVLGN